MKLKQMTQRLGYLLLLNAVTTGAMAQDTISERQQKAREVLAMYAMAEQAYKDGDVTACRDIIKSVLALQPGYPHAVALKRRLRLSGNQMVLAKKKRIFNAVQLKVVDYNDLTIAQALKLLGARVEAQSGGKVIPNFVVQDPKRYLGDERITLKLKNVPAGVVLSNILQAAKCSAIFGKYTISIRPRASAFVNKKPAVLKQEAGSE